MPASYTPEILGSVSDLLDNLRDIPPDELSQSEAEVTLVDVADTMAAHAESSTWSWIACFCEEGGKNFLYPYRRECSRVLISFAHAFDTVTFNDRLLFSMKTFLLFYLFFFFENIHMNSHRYLGYFCDC